MWQSIIDTLAECTKDEDAPTVCIARNEESGKVYIYVKMICKQDAKIGMMTKWRDSMWDNLKELDEGEIDFSKEEWYQKIFDIKAPGLHSIYSVKKSGQGKKIKTKSLAKYFPLNEDYKIYDPLRKISDVATYRRRLIRLLWRCSIYNTDGCKKFDPDWYADALSISQKLNGLLVPIKIACFLINIWLQINGGGHYNAQKWQYQFLMEVYQSAKISSFINLVRGFLPE